MADCSPIKVSVKELETGDGFVATTDVASCGCDDGYIEYNIVSIKLGGYRDYFRDEFFNYKEKLLATLDLEIDVGFFLGDQNIKLSQGDIIVYSQDAVKTDKTGPVTPSNIGISIGSLNRVKISVPFCITEVGGEICPKPGWCFSFQIGVQGFSAKTIYLDNGCAYWGLSDTITVCDGLVYKSSGTSGKIPVNKGYGDPQNHDAVKNILYEWYDFGNKLIKREYAKAPRWDEPVVNSSTLKLSEGDPYKVVAICNDCRDEALIKTCPTETITNILVNPEKTKVSFDYTSSKANSTIVFDLYDDDSGVGVKMGEINTDVVGGKFNGEFVLSTPIKNKDAFIATNYKGINCNIFPFKVELQTTLEVRSEDTGDVGALEERGLNCDCEGWHIKYVLGLDAPCGEVKMTNCDGQKLSYCFNSGESMDLCVQKGTLEFAKDYGFDFSITDPKCFSFNCLCSSINSEFSGGNKTIKKSYTANASGSLKIVFTAEKIPDRFIFSKNGSVLADTGCVTCDTSEKVVCKGETYPLPGPEFVLDHKYYDYNFYSYSFDVAKDDVVTIEAIGGCSSCFSSTYWNVVASCIPDEDLSSKIPDPSPSNAKLSVIDPIPGAKTESVIIIHTSPSVTPSTQVKTVGVADLLGALDDLGGQDFGSLVVDPTPTPTITATPSNGHEICQACTKSPTPSPTVTPTTTPSATITHTPSISLTNSFSSSITPSTVIVIPPSGLTMLGPYSDRVTLTWNGGTDNYFQILRTDEFGGNQVSSVWQTETVYEDFTALPSTSYFYFVRAASNDNGDNPTIYDGPVNGFRSNIVSSTPTPSITASPVSPTPTPTRTATHSRTPSRSMPDVTPSVTLSVSVSPTVTPTPVSNSVTPTASESPVTPSITPTLTRTPTVTPTITVSKTTSRTATVTPSPVSPSVTPTVTPSEVSPSVTPTETPSPVSPSVTPTASVSPESPSVTPTPTATPGSPSVTPTITISPSVTPSMICELWGFTYNYGPWECGEIGATLCNGTPVTYCLALGETKELCIQPETQWAAHDYGIDVYPLGGSCDGCEYTFPYYLLDTVCVAGTCGITTGVIRINDTCGRLTTNPADYKWNVDVTNSGGVNVYVDVNPLHVSGGPSSVNLFSTSLEETCLLSDVNKKLFFKGVMIWEHDFVGYNSRCFYDPLYGGVPCCDPSVTPTPTVTGTPSETPTVTPSVTITPTVTPSITESATNTVTPTLSISNTGTPDSTPTITPTVTPSITESVTITPTETPTVTPSLSESSTMTPSLSVSSSSGEITPSPTPTTTETPSLSESNTVTPTVTPSITESETPTVTPSLSESATKTPTKTVTPSLSVSNTRTPSITPTVTPSLSRSSSLTPTISSSNSFSSTKTPSLSRSSSLTPTISPSNSFSSTKTPSLSVSSSLTPTVTPSLSFSNTVTPSISVSNTRTPTVTPSLSVSNTRTPSLSLSNSVSNTRTPSLSVSNSTSPPPVSVTPTRTPSTTPPALCICIVYSVTCENSLCSLDAFNCDGTSYHLAMNQDDNVVVCLQQDSIQNQFQFTIGSLVGCGSGPCGGS